MRRLSASCRSWASVSLICGPQQFRQIDAGASDRAESSDARAVHLDLLYHLPHTDWEPRPMEEFVALHATRRSPTTAG